MTESLWQTLWTGYVFPGGLILVHILMLLVPLLVAVAYLTLMERKVLAAMSLRMGPNVVGPFGLLQPLADAAKLIFKETIIPSGANKFLFDHVGLVEAHHPDSGTDHEGAAIEAGANEVEVLSHEQNDDIPEGACGARFICERTAVHTVAEWLKANGWSVVTSEIGYVPKQFSELNDEQRAAVGEFLQQFEDHDDVHRVWAALK